MPKAGFEAAIPASEQPQTNALDRAANRIGSYSFFGIHYHVQFYLPAKMQKKKTEQVR
jgi:hypothetical protein